jgi:DNA polymerase III delta subunit
MSVRFLVGDEPYWIDSEIKKVTDAVAMPEMNLLRSDKLSEEVFSFLSAMPFMAERKAAVVTVADLSECDSPLLNGFECPEESDLVMRARAYDARKTFYKSLAKKGVITVCSKAALGKKLDSFVLKKAGERGLAFSEEAFRELLFLENYADAEEVTCYSIIADLDSLAAVTDGKPSVEDVRRIVDGHHKGNAFVVAGMIAAGNVKGLIEQADALKGQEIGSLAALLREYRISYKACHFRLSEIGVTRKTLDIGEEEALEGVRILTEALQATKSDSPSGAILQETYLRLLAMHKTKKESAV